MKSSLGIRRSPAPARAASDAPYSRAFGRSRFVIHEHQARHLHFDLRIEKDGVLKSWVLPRGPMLGPGERRLAIEAPDHPLAYAAFEGTIPPGEYGAGTVRIWDQGPCDLREWTPERIIIVLHGKRLRGAFALVPFGRAGPRRWLFLSLRRAPQGTAAARDAAMSNSTPSTHAWHLP